ncbi:MAG: hypothetical protein HOV97_03795, partial [Nonomuraea sp.]|nr:hypothetical protein [Nonomuraea sp.]
VRAHDGVTARLETLTGDLAPAHRDVLTAAIDTILTEDTTRTGRTWSA